LGQRDRVGSRHFQLGCIALEQSDYQQARAQYEQSQVMAHELGNQELVAAALSGQGRIAQEKGELARAAALFHESLTVFRDLGIQGAIAETLIKLAAVAYAQGDEKTARALLDESVALRPEDEVWPSTLASAAATPASVCMLQGHVFLELGDYAGARSRYERGLSRQRALEDPWLIGWALIELGHAAWLQGEEAVTQSHAVEALRLFQPFENPAGTLAALESLAGASLLQGPGTRGYPRSGSTDGARAARLAGAVAAQREALGPSRPDWWLRPRERITEALHAASLEKEFAAAWAEGRALSLEQAVAFALEERCSWEMAAWGAASPATGPPGWDGGAGSGTLRPSR
jgi:tetratricopeptide (TPR) repeat protein